MLALLFGATACIAATPNRASIATATDANVNSPETPNDWWRPPLDTTWQWQLGDAPIDQSFDVDMYDIDLFDQSAAVVAALHAKGRKVVCYISVGSYEDWREDADQFPDSVLGNDYEGWPGEKWLDIRQIDVLAPIMRARLDLCKEKGFDAVEPDNMDSYTNDTGFPLTYDDQLTYNRWLANEAHQRGLSIGLKNNPEQVADLVEDFDWALTEDCFEQGWCDDLLPFLEAGKPVFAAEYTDTGSTLDDFCAQAQAMRINAILKNRDLDAPRQACPETEQTKLFVPAIMHESS
jgi:endo-alpha-1,4-polygalactosaminidase (GH114 family)